MGMQTAKSLVGQKFGMLTVLYRAPNKGVQTMWACSCDCGGEVVMQGYKLKHHPDPDCGCRRAKKIGDANRTHGYFGTPTYDSWSGMKQRAGKWKGYEHVTVCERWEKFENFLEDMGDRPEGTTLDRIDNDKGYEPSNCRWATPTEQSRNRKYCRTLTKDGVTKTAAEWAAELKMPRTNFYRWLDEGKLDSMFDNLG